MTQMRPYRPVRVVRMLVLACVATVLAGCATSTASAPPAPPAPARPSQAQAPPGEVRISGAVGKAGSIGLAQLAAMPSQTVSVAFGSSKGAERHTETGTPLVGVIDRAGLAAVAGGKHDQLSFAVLVIGSDGYQVAISYGEMAPEFGNHPVLLATAEDGRPLARPRLVVPGDVKGARYVTDVVGLHVVRLAAPAPG
jgi:hypothetical protein